MSEINVKKVKCTFGHTLLAKGFPYIIKYMDKTFIATYHDGDDEKLTFVFFNDASERSTLELAPNDEFTIEYPRNKSYISSPLTDLLTQTSSISNIDIPGLKKCPPIELIPKSDVPIHPNCKDQLYHHIFSLSHLKREVNTLLDLMDYEASAIILNYDKDEILRFVIPFNGHSVYINNVESVSGPHGTYTAIPRFMYNTSRLTIDGEFYVIYTIASPRILDTKYGKYFKYHPMFENPIDHKQYEYICIGTSITGLDMMIDELKPVENKDVGTIEMPMSIEAYSGLQLLWLFDRDVDMPDYIKNDWFKIQTNWQFFGIHHLGYEYATNYNHFRPNKSFNGFFGGFNYQSDYDWMFLPNKKTFDGIINLADEINEVENPMWINHHIFGWDTISKVDRKKTGKDVAVRYMMYRKSDIIYDDED